MTEKERKIELNFIQKSKTDKTQFGFLYEKYYRQLYIFIFKKIQEEDLAGDLCSKTFLKAMVNIDKYEDRGFPFSSWLYRIASNEVNQFFREQKKSLTISVDEHRIVAIVEEMKIDSRDDKLQLILQALEKLPLEKSQLIELRFFEGLSFKEIGSIFDIPEATAKMRTYRILEAMKNKMTYSDDSK